MEEVFATKGTRVLGIQCTSFIIHAGISEQAFAHTQFKLPHGPLCCAYVAQGSMYILVPMCLQACTLTEQLVCIW